MTTAPSVLTTRTLDLTDREQIRAWFRASEVTHRHDRPEAPFWTEDEAVHLIRPDDAEERYHPFVAEDGDGTILGTGIVFVPLVDNLDKVYFPLSVLPEHRGKGIGDALVEHVLGIARAEGRQVLLGEGNLPADHDESHPVRRFAARHGFTLANTEVRRRLDLPVPDATIQDWVDAAAQHHEGYEVTTYVDMVPPELRPSLVELLTQLAVDAPTGDIDFEAGGMTVEMYDEQAQRRIETGRRTLITVAVKDGEAVAHSTLSVPPGDTEMPHLNQWGTYVHRAHRGHRLGLAVKAANLRAVQEMHPERTVITTTNSPVNAPMVAINELMGFRPVDVFAEFLRRL
ncbi:MAG: GNAT family N-acetyltransferase [Nocardioides sp.]